MAASFSLTQQPKLSISSPLHKNMIISAKSQHQNSFINITSPAKIHHLQKQIIMHPLLWCNSSSSSYSSKIITALNSSPMEDQNTNEDYLAKSDIQYFADEFKKFKNKACRQFEENRSIMCYVHVQYLQPYINKFKNAAISIDQRIKDSVNGEWSTVASVEFLKEIVSLFLILSKYNAEADWMYKYDTKDTSEDFEIGHSKLLLWLPEDFKPDDLKGKEFIPARFIILALATFIKILSKGQEKTTEC